MSSKKTSDKKKTAETRRSSNSFTTADDQTLSPLGHNSFALAPGDSRTSDTRFGPIGGPSPTNRESGFVLFALHSQLAPAVRHAASLADLNPSSTQRTLRSNQPGSSYVTNLATWRRGADQTAPPAPPRAEVRGQGRPEVRREAPDRSRDEGRPAGFDGRTTAYQVRELEKYQEKRQQQEQVQKGGQQQQALWRGPREPFKPMNVKLDPEAANRPLSKEEKAYRDARGISYNYKGDARNPTNESADIPDEDNCAVWVTKLPPDCTYKDLLRAVAVHRPGKVFATVISPPKKPENWRQARLSSTRCSAAKIVFYYAQSARDLIDVAGEGNFIVNGYQASVILNKIKVAPQPFPNRTSRCVEITGPADVVGKAELTPLFNQFFWWETEEVVVLKEGYPPYAAGLKFRTIEWRFASYQAQASSAYHTIMDHCPAASAHWSQDPCEDVLTDQMQQMSLGQ